MREPIPGTQADYKPSNSYWLELDKKYRIKHRYTSDVVLSKGQGVTLTDVEGKEYIDFESGQVCVSLGHCHPDYTAAICRQAARLVQTGSQYTDPTQVLLTKKIAETTGGKLNKSYLACTGAESNEAAIRLAKAYTGRFEVVSFMANYHGMTMVSWAATGFGGQFRDPYGPAVNGMSFLPTPFTYPTPNPPRFPHRDPDVIRACIEFCKIQLDATTSGRPAAIMLELVQSAGGVRVLPVEFVRAIRAMCDERGALLVIDEAQTGLGRLGTWWGYEHYGILPDILTSSKTLGGGIPLSAMITTEEIAEKGVERGFRQSSSHTGDPLLCAVGLANLEIIEREGLVENVRTVGAHMKQRLERFAESSPIIGEIRGMGFLLGIEVVNADTKSGENVAATRSITDYCRKNGLLTGWWPTAHLAANVIRLMPPYVLTKSKADEALDIIEEAVRRTA